MRGYPMVQRVCVLGARSQLKLEDVKEVKAVLRAEFKKNHLEGSFEG
jgi:hypothetical protein